MITMVDALMKRAGEDPDRIALVHQGQEFSYGAFADRTRLWQAAFASYRLARFDRVAIYLEKQIDLVAALLGAIAAGTIAVPINPQLKPKQVTYILTDCDAQILVTSASRLEMLAPELEAVAWPEIILCDAPRPGRGGDLHRPRSFPAIMESLVQPTLSTPTTDGDPAAILYTSGSTGLPKGIVLSHRNLCAGAQSVNDYLGHSADDVILSVLPLSFDAGLSQLTTSLMVGARLVLVNFITAQEISKIAAACGATSLTAVPPLWRQLASVYWTDEARSSLRLFANTGGHMPRDLLDNLRSLFPSARPYLMYGLTEAFRSTYLDPTEIDRRPGSIGKAVPNAEVHVLRPDGTPTAPDECGELVHRGACVTLGYWNRPDLTAQRFRPFPRQASAIPTSDLAVWSGDLVKRDAEGFIYFVTRPEDMIKTSGYRVSPTEIEEVVLGSGLVGEAVAFGVPHPDLDYAIVLVATPRNVDARSRAVWSNDVRAHCRRNLPRYMVPHAILDCEALPRNANGKFDRSGLNAAHRDLFISATKGSSAGEGNSP